MAKSGLRVVRRPRNPPRTQHKIIREEVRKRLKPVADEHVKRRETIVSSWQAHHKPKFDSRVGVGTKQIFVQVLIKNASQSLGKYGGTVRDLWGWINEGTRPHIIVPRFASILRFVIDGKIIFALRVNHPGTQGQRHNERINAELDRKFQGAVNNGYRAGFRKIKE
jgi:hypothetical protein